MTPVSQQVVEKGLELLDTAVKLGANEAPKILQEYLNYMIFVTLLDIVKLFIFACIPYVIFKIMGRSIAYEKAQMKELEPEYKNNFHGLLFDYNWNRWNSSKDAIENLTNWRYALCIMTTLSLGFMSANSFDRLGKIVLAPKVFMIQEGAKLLKANKP